MLPKYAEICSGNQWSFNMKSVAGLMHFLQTIEITFFLNFRDFFSIISMYTRRIL